MSKKTYTIDFGGCDFGDAPKAGGPKPVEQFASVPAPMTLRESVVCSLKTWRKVAMVDALSHAARAIAHAAAGEREEAADWMSWAGVELRRIQAIKKALKEMKA